ncbi:CheY-like superfamily [Penicillium chrysogenum]|uniref:CheY-like superfamily n=1 Tax=Penicillium chrysogenum TaxID=5076 RepID=UPI0024DF2D24|nr:CheY-like superfamily [Penicillium chrysogenum]KAJ5245003.1 CheY-like superfamily [Penicillium chrysogenum]KAJ5849160.1 CheY-like superfamily [Penicillium rubens]
MSLSDEMHRISIDEDNGTFDRSIAVIPGSSNEPETRQIDPAPGRHRQDGCPALTDDLSVITCPRRADDNLSRLYRCTPTPTIVLDGSLRVIEVSESHLTCFQLTRAQLIHTSVYNLEPHTVPVPDTAILSGALVAALETQAVQVLHDIHVLESNACFSLRVTPVFEDKVLLYVLLEAQDPIMAQAASDVLSEKAYLNETYRILVDSVKDYAIFMLDPRGHIATWNSGAAILKGYTANEIIGKHFSFLYGQEDRDTNKPAKELEICMREGKVEDEGWRYRNDGTRFWANVMITAIYKSGRHVGFVKVTRDLTERKAAEARLIDAFEETSKLKTDFLANMSHEIRTPMNGMSLALSMLTNTTLSNEQAEYASIIEDSTSTLLQVINDVLDYSKLSSGAFTLNVNVLSVPDVVNAVVRNCKPSLKPGVMLENTITPGFPQTVKGDPLRFRQVLQNLVSNAVKFTERGYVRITTTYSVDVKDPKYLNVSSQVVDSGIGVPEDAVNTLFTPFTQSANSAAKLYQGTGLGLSICKSLAELMHGSVGFHANPDGQGSVFWMVAKMIRPDAPVSHKGPTNLPMIEEPSDPSARIREIAPHKHILLVEDNKVNQTIMLKLLFSLGFRRVDLAWDGAEAVQLVKQKPLAYNVILMDINMPVMDGLAATAQIRQMNINVPILALTGNALKGDSEIYMAKGMNDYVAKPLHRQQLLELLWKWVGT